MARLRGAANYKNRVLIGIVHQMLPNGSYAWTAVADAYQTASGERTVRNGDDMRKHWLRKLCNNMKKPMGSTGGNEDHIHECIAIERRIMEKTHSGMLGLSDGDDEDAEDEDGGSGTAVGGSPLRVPTLPGITPCRRSPRRTTPSDGADGAVEQSNAGVDQLTPPSPLPQVNTASTTTASTRSVSATASTRRASTSSTVQVRSRKILQIKSRNVRPL